MTLRQLEDLLDALDNRPLEGANMLVLARRPNERVLIGEDIEVIVVEVDPRTHKVRLGFRAPPHVRILREELAYAEQGGEAGSA